MPTISYTEGDGFEIEYLEDVTDPTAVSSVVIVAKSPVQAGSAYEPADDDPSPFAQEVLLDADGQAYARDTGGTNWIIRRDDLDASFTVVVAE